MYESLEAMSDKVGFAPGTLVHVGETRKSKVNITLIEYDSQFYQEKSENLIEQILPFDDATHIRWIHVDGLHNVDIIRKIGENFNIHPLILEDILNTEQRPKLDIFEDYIYIVFKEISSFEDVRHIKYDQISIVVGQDFVITFTENKSNIFEPLKNRIRKAKGRIRKMGADYLAYSIMDLIVDRYFILEDAIDEVIENLEEELLSDPDSSTLKAIQQLKREMILLKRSVLPLRVLLNDIIREDHPLIDEAVKFYFRDVYDHSIRICEAIEGYRDLLGGMLDIYLSLLSNKMNEIMKVLTIFAAIFIPLTFIAGIYGMNFEYMPELKWKWAYPSLWGFILITASFLILYFKKKKWL